MNESSFDKLAAGWSTTRRLESTRYVGEIVRRRRRLLIDLAAATMGAALVAVLAVAFGLWAVITRSPLMAVSAIAFAAGVPVLINARIRLLGLMRLAYDASPGAHVTTLEASLADDQRRLVDARTCVLILAVAAVCALGLVALRQESAVALIPATAWVATAAALEAWRRRRLQRLRHAQQSLALLRRELYDPDAPQGSS